MQRCNLKRFESLEVRRCLTVVVEVDNGDLLVSGDADGAVEITAVDATTYEVRDNGELVATAEDVTDDIRVTLDLDGPTMGGADDEVTINLAGQSVDMIFADLGDGENSLFVSGGVVNRNLIYRGGDGGDALEIAADAQIERSVYAILGPMLDEGNNSLAVEGSIGRNLLVKAGLGDDTVSLADTASVGRRVYTLLGDGDNNVSLAGQIDGLSVRGGLDDDTVEVLAEATIAGSASVNLGDGVNNLSVDGLIEGNLRYRGADGNDSVMISGEATVEGDVRMKLGAGENNVMHAGAIEGDLYVISANEQDVVDIAEDAIVGGERQLFLGQQGEFGHCGFRGGAFALAGMLRRIFLR